MEKMIIKSANILFPDSEFYQKQADVFIENGYISSIAAAGTLAKHKDVFEIDGHDKFIAPGFFDLNVNFGEPGNETKEDFLTGIATAAAGGFTGVALQPNTSPPLQSRAEIAFV